MGVVRQCYLANYYGIQLNNYSTESWETTSCGKTQRTDGQTEKTATQVTATQVWAV